MHSISCLQLPSSSFYGNKDDGPLFTDDNNQVKGWGKEPSGASAGTREATALDFVRGLFLARGKM